MVNVNVTDKATGCITAVKSMEKQQRYHVPANQHNKREKPFFFSKNTQKKE
eukprot:m.120850 g.120850  ORF g.120850 m.120850 type:complete len:51 (+) comp12917_c0_seq1:152-304(+)